MHDEGLRLDTNAISMRKSAPVPRRFADFPRYTSTDGNDTRATYRLATDRATDRLTHRAAPCELPIGHN